VPDIYSKTKRPVFAIVRHGLTYLPDYLYFNHKGWTGCVIPAEAGIHDFRIVKPDFEGMDPSLRWGDIDCLCRSSGFVEKNDGELLLIGRLSGVDFVAR